MTVKKKIMYMFISNYKRFAIRKKAFFSRVCLQNCNSAIERYSVVFIEERGESPL